MAKKKSNAGRKTVVTPEVVRKLETAFMMSFTDEEACLFAGISMRTLYAHCTRFPEFAQRKQLLKQNVSMQAKKNIADAIADNDEDLSKWWLERKNKEEFSLKNEVDHKSSDGSMGNRTPDEYAQAVGKITREIMEEYRRSKEEQD